MNKLLDWIEARHAGWKLLALIVLTVVVLLVARCAGPSESPIPAPLLAEGKAYDAGAPKVIEQITAAKQSADASNARSVAHNAQSELLEQSAQREAHLADSLAAVAALAQSARDSAAAWQHAYDERTEESATLVRSLALKDSAYLDQRHRGDSLDVALFKSDSLRKRAESLMHDVVREASRGGCSVPGTFGLVGCPDRKTALVTGVVIGVLAPVAWNNRAKILPLVSLTH